MKKIFQKVLETALKKEIAKVMAGPALNTLPLGNAKRCT